MPRTESLPIRHRGVTPVLLGAVLLALSLASPLPAQQAAPPDDTQAPSPGAGQPLPDLPDCPPERDLCLQADRSGGIDLRTGVATLEGNVVGMMRSRGLSFHGETLRAFRNGSPTWKRLVLEEDVRLAQADQEASSDQGLLEENLIRLSGNVSLRQPEWHIEAHEVVIDSAAGTTRLTSLPDTLLTLTFRRRLLVAPGGESAESATAPSTGEPPSAGDEAARTTRIRTRNAVLDRNRAEFVLTGQVAIEQLDGSLDIRAHQVTLTFHPDHTLKRFQADGDVVIRQPERTVSADHAATRDDMETIVLTGNATLRDKDTFDLQADRLEVYTDARRGVVQSRQPEQPITLSLDLGPDTGFRLTTEGLGGLARKGLPPATLAKLSPLVNRPFPNRAEFRKAVSGVLSAEETSRHFDAIAGAAR